VDDEKTRKAKSDRGVGDYIGEVPASLQNAATNAEPMYAVLYDVLQTAEVGLQLVKFHAVTAHRLQYMGAMHTEMMCGALDDLLQTVHMSVEHLQSVASILTVLRANLRAAPPA
jgi:hypothetical protein